jgi:hypothetical protein
VLIISHAGLVVFTKQFNDDIQQVLGRTDTLPASPSAVWH